MDIDNIKKIFNDEKLKSKAFFIFYGIFFLVFFLIFAFTPEKEVEEDNTILERKKDIIEKYDNYSFSHLIKFNESEILLYGSVYNNKTLIHKKIDEVENVYYVYYDEIYELKGNDKYGRYEGAIIESFDMKLINPEYLEEVLNDSLLQNESTNEVKYFNSDANIELTFNYDSKNELQSIVVIKDGVSVESKYYNEGNVSDINVDIEK